MLRFSAVSTANLSSGTHAQAQNIEPARTYFCTLVQKCGTLYLGEGGRETDLPLASDLNVTRRNKDHGTTSRERQEKAVRQKI